MRVPLACTAALLILILAPIESRANVIRYEIALDRDLMAATIDACFGQQVPRALSFSDEIPARIFSGMVPEGPPAPYGTRYRAMNVARGCAHYALDFSGLPAGTPHAGFQRLRDAILIDPGWLLAVPADAAADSYAVRLTLPTKFKISAPVAVRADGRGRWRLELTPRAWARGGRLAIGRLQQTRGLQHQAIFEISVAGQSARLPRQDYARWVQDISEVVGTHFGRFPVPFVQVLVILQGPGPEIVPWGEVVRTGGDGLLLYVDRTRSRAQLARDWVAYHEFSHFLHPYFGPGDSWWAEGLASYYQNVLRAQAHQLSAHAGWQALHAGFERGRAETDGQATLAAASRDMLVHRQFMRVYWSGAAIALLADVELRLRSQGRHTLTSVLAKFATCCLPVARPWTAREFMQKLDQISGFPILVPLLEQSLDDVKFPDLTPAYAVLGLRAQDGKLDFASGHAEQRLREAIMGSEPVPPP
jgi:hypothetical protein